MDENQLHQKDGNVDSFSALTQIFCALPKYMCDVGDYGFTCDEIEEGGYVLSIIDVDPEDVEQIKKFLQKALDEEVEGHVWEETEQGLHVRVDSTAVLLDLLVNFVENGEHNLSDDQVKFVTDGINDVIQREESSNKPLTPRELICDVFNNLLETAGLKNHEAYFHDMEDEFFEISIDSDGNSHPKFVEFCNELAECCEHENVSPNISGDCDQLILGAEDEMAMVQVLKAYFQDCKMETAEEMIVAGTVNDEEYVVKRGNDYARSLDDVESFENYPMIAVPSADRSNFLAKMFYLKANETTTINLDAIETAILQEQKDYKAMKEHHRRFIVH